MKPHQERVVVEKRELDEKLGKLVDFILNSPLLQNVDRMEQFRLQEQRFHMTEYSRVLGERIEAFQKEAA